MCITSTQMSPYLKVLMFYFISGTNSVDNLFQTVGQVSKAVGTLVNIMTVDNDDAAGPIQSQSQH